MRPTLKETLVEYGPIAIGVYAATFAMVLVGSYFAIRMGWAPVGISGQASTWMAAYVVTKLTQPLRIAATVVLSVALGKLLRRRRKGD